MKTIVFLILAIVAISCSEDFLLPTEEFQEEVALEAAQDSIYDYYYGLYKDGLWELLNNQIDSLELGGVDWAERSLRNPNLDYVLPSKAPYKFDANTGLSFIKK